MAKPGKTKPTKGVDIVIIFLVTVLLLFGLVALLNVLSDPFEGKLLAQQESLSHELELNHSEMETLEADEEVTAEELTEFRTDVERLNRELGRLEKDVRSLLDQLEKTSADFQKARSLGAKAKKEYDRLKAVVEVEKSEGAADITTATKEMETVER